MVSVTSMATTAIAEEREAASQRNSWKREAGRNSKSLVTQVPIRALMKWPKMRARGCAKGLSIAPKTRTADAP